MRRVESTSEDPSWTCWRTAMQETNAFRIVLAGVILTAVGDISAGLPQEALRRKGLGGSVPEMQQAEPVLRVGQSSPSAPFIAPIPFVPADRLPVISANFQVAGAIGEAAIPSELLKIETPFQEANIPPLGNSPRGVEPAIESLIEAISVTPTERLLATDREENPLQFVQHLEPGSEVPSIPPVPRPLAPQPDPIGHSADPLFEKRFADLNKPMNDIGLAMSANSGPMPKNYAAELNDQSQTEVLGGDAGWVEHRANRYPVPFFYQPLYFEERNLERCGEGFGFAQPLVSSAAFVKNTICLPYHLVVSPPRSLVQTPGDCPTCYRFPILHQE